MIAWMIAAFLLLKVPFVTVAVIDLVRDVGHGFRVVTFAGEVANVVNSSVRLPIYLTTCGAFRDTMRRLFSSDCGGEELDSDSEEDSDALRE